MLMLPVWLNSSVICVKDAQCWCSRGSSRCDSWRSQGTSSTADSPSTHSCWPGWTTLWRSVLLLNFEPALASENLSPETLSGSQELKFSMSDSVTRWCHSLYSSLQIKRNQYIQVLDWLVLWPHNVAEPRPDQLKRLPPEPCTVDTAWLVHHFLTLTPVAQE